MNLQLYFRSVCHLSDARFASAAGAEFVGFPWYPSSGTGISLADYLDILQWISGPVPVLQIHAHDLGLFSSIHTASEMSAPPSKPLAGLDSNQTASQAQRIAHNPYSTMPSPVIPHALEVALSGSQQNMPDIRPECPLLWKVDVRQQELPALFRFELDYLVLDPADCLLNPSQQPKPADLPKNWLNLLRLYRCFLEIPFTTQNPMEWVETFNPYGVGLSGQPELAVGKRDYSAWQDFTDLLEDSGLS